MFNRLHQAASAGDIEQIRELITKKKYNPNQLDWVRELPPLVFAAEAGQLEAMKELVRLGANLHYKSQNRSLWFYALESDRAFAIFQYLVEAGLPYSPNELHPTHLGVTSFFRTTLLWYMAKAKHWDLVAWSLSHPEADVNACPAEKSHKSITVLWLAAGWQRWALVKEILNKFPEANINACPAEGSDKGMTVLWMAAYWQQWELAKEMLNQFPQANINARSVQGPNKGKTVLWLAAYWQQWELVKEMLNKYPQADINANPAEGSNKGKTVLWWAAYWQQWELVLSVLGSKGLSDVLLELLTSTPQNEQSIFQLAFQQEDKIVKERLFYNLLIRAFLLADKTRSSIWGFLFAEKPRLFTHETLSVMLQQQEKKLLTSLFGRTKPSVEVKEEAVNLIRQASLNLIRLFDAMESLWSSSPSSRFNIHPMPEEIRLDITSYLFGHPSLVNLEKGMKERLINCFIDSHAKNKAYEVEALNEGREFCAKLARLAIHAWRQEQSKSTDISQARVKDYYARLSKSLLQELILGDEFPSLNSKAYTNFLKRYCYNPSIAPQLQKTIIEEIVKLKPKDFNKSTLEALIREAVATYTSVSTRAIGSKEEQVATNPLNTRL